MKFETCKFVARGYGCYELWSEAISARFIKFLILLQSSEVAKANQNRRSWRCQEKKKGKIN